MPWAPVPEGGRSLCVTGHLADVEQALQFRTRQQIEYDLLAAGLVALRVWRDWAQTPFGGTQAEQLMVFEAAPA